MLVNVQVDNQIKYRIMKTLKKSKKITKTPNIVVNYTNVDSVEDVMMESIIAKVRAGIAITEEEFMYVFHRGADIAIEAFEDFYMTHTTVIENDRLAKNLLKMLDKAIANKKPWYKRFWAWLTKPFKKNK